MKSALRKSLRILTVTALVLATTEFIARLILPKFANDDTYLDRALERLVNSAIRVDPSGKNFNRRFGFALSPNSANTEATAEFTYTSRTNSLGFRTKEVAPKGVGEYRVMLLGDSFFWGVGVKESETIAAFMESLGRPNLSVYNYSVVGYNTVQELIVAKTYVESLNPDHIILGFFIGNDMISNAMTFIDENGNYEASSAMEAKIRSELRKSLGVLFHSVIFRVIALPVYVPRIRYQIATSDRVIVRSYELLAELNNLARRAGRRFSVVIVYPRDSVQGGMVETWSGSRRAGELILAFCRRNSIEALDIIGYMNTAEHKERYFFKRDGHPNKEGNLVIARAILNDLMESSAVRR